MKKTLISLLLLLAMAVSPVAAQVPDIGDLVQMRVLPGWRLANGNHMVGVEFTLAKGWKTYWRNPGDAGIPPAFNLSRSRNVAGFVTHWPLPGVFRDYGVRTIGYKGRVLLPLEITPRTMGRDIALRGSVNLGVCAEVCIPVDLNFTASLSANSRKPDVAIGDALASQPIRIGGFTCSIRPTKTGIVLETSLKYRSLGRDETLVIEVPGADLWVEQTTSQRRGKTIHGKTKVENVAGNGVSFSRDQVRATLLVSGRAVEALGCNRG